MHRKFALLMFIAPVAGCNPHVTIDQAKPIEINLNISGRVDLVIHAQKDMESITGEKPTNTVRPEDIGLPPARTGGALEPMETPLLADLADTPVLLRTAQPRAGGAPEKWVVVALIDDLKKSMAARDKLVRPLWDSKLVGESHSGLLEAKGSLTAEQKKLMDEENADRRAYFAEAGKNDKISADEAALAFYIARLGYAKAGAWYEKKNAAGAWEWKQWGS